MELVHLQYNRSPETRARGSFQLSHLTFRISEPTPPVMNADVLSTPTDEVRADPVARPKLLDPAVAWSLPAIFGRSLFPVVALALIAGTMLWGPWISLVLTFAWWRCVTWFG